MLLLAGQFFAGGMDVLAASKQKTRNLTDLSMSVGQSQKFKIAGSGKASMTAKISGKKLLA